MLKISLEILNVGIALPELFSQQIPRNERFFLRGKTSILCPRVDVDRERGAAPTMIPRTKKALYFCYDYFLNLASDLFPDQFLSLKRKNAIAPTNNTAAH